MISLRNICKRYPIHAGYKTVLDNINLDISPGERIGILGRNGSGKSTLIRILSKAERPTTGTVSRSMSVSWPLAFSGGFQGSLTGLDNVRFICRIYGIPFNYALEYVKDFSELGRDLREPVKTYSSGMKARLAFALSMAVEFDCYLIDEVVAVGDYSFQTKCQTELFEKRAHKSMVIVSHNADFIVQHCTSAAILEKGRMTFFDDVTHALEWHHKHAQATA